MVKPTSGFVTKHGRFFDVKEEAELNEAETDLVEAFNKTDHRETETENMTVDQFLVLISVLEKELRSYLDARSHLSVPKSRQNVSDDKRKLRAVQQQ